MRLRSDTKTRRCRIVTLVVTLIHIEVFLSALLEDLLVYVQEIASGGWNGCNYFNNDDDDDDEN